MELDELVRQFEACTLAKAEWTHEAHLAVGAWHVDGSLIERVARLLDRPLAARLGLVAPVVPLGLWFDL